LQCGLQFCVWPERATDPVRGLAGERIGGIGVDASGTDLGVAKNALYDVHVDVLLAEQRSGGMARIMQPGTLADAGLGQECLPLVPVIVRVDGAATRLAPDQIPVLPGSSPASVSESSASSMAARWCRYANNGAGA